MPIESRQIDAGAAVITISGRLVFGRDVERLESLVDDMIQKGPTRFVFDVSSLDYADSSGIGAMVACLTHIRKSGADLRMAGASPRIRRLLTMTGVDQLLPMYATVAEATAG